MKFIEKLTKLKKEPNYSTKSSIWLAEELVKSNSKDLYLITKAYLTYSGKLPLNLEKGKLYWTQYDISKEVLDKMQISTPTNKSTPLERFIPFLLVDYIPELDPTVIWCMNLNFLPLVERERVFLKLVNNKIYENNILLNKFSDEKGIESFNLIELKNIIFPFTYSIRPYKINLLYNLYGVKTSAIDKFITINLKVLPQSMDDKGAYKILNGKIEEILAEYTNSNNFSKIKQYLDEKLKIYNDKIGNYS